VVNTDPVAEVLIHPAESPYRIERPFSVQEWSRLTFLHWAYDPAVVQRLLPGGLEVDAFEGRAWVGLVPFWMRAAFPPLFPAIPYLTSLPETNLRTYVSDASGRPGVWFLSLDLPRLAGVVLARAMYSLPYVWSRMSVVVAGGRIDYRAIRLQPRRGARSHVAVEIGGAIQTTDLETFLTARWGLYTSHRGRVRFAPIAHPTWRLRSARVLELEDQLVAASGLPAPAGPPVAYHAEPIVAQLMLPV
jgi:uncharacterized protein YqjF (DUF2071 family)